MEQSLQSGSLKAFDMLREAAREYNGSEYKFYENGFFKYKLYGSDVLFVEDIYINPDFRGTPVASIILSNFETFMRDSGVEMYYGRVFKSSPSYEIRLATFKRWGMVELSTNDYYTLICKSVAQDERAK